MEVLHSLGIDWKILIAQVINFGILLFVLTRFLYTPIQGALEKRKKTIAESLVKAKEAEKRFEQAEAEYKARIAEAKKEFDSIVEQAKIVGEQARKEIVEKAEAEIVLFKAHAEDQIKRDREELSREMKKQIGTLAVFIVTKILKTQLKESDLQKSIETALQDVKIK